jgi:lysophospholipase L1-like esterase
MDRVLDDVEEADAEPLIEECASPSQQHTSSLHRRVRRYGLVLLAFVAVLGTSLIVFDAGRPMHGVAQSAKKFQQTVRMAFMQKFAPTAVAPVPWYHTWSLMPMGDSITFGQGSETLGGYRCPLDYLLKNHGLNHALVGPYQIPGNCGGHAGYQGATLEVIGFHARQDVQTFSPDVVLLQAGTNDFFRIGHGRVGGADALAAANRLRVLLGEIYLAKPTVTVALSTVTQVNETLCSMHWQCPSSMPSNIAGFNVLLPGIVAEQQGLSRNVVLHNVNAVANFRTEDYHQFGMHFSDLGYQKIANAWLTAIIPLAPANVR